MGHLDAAHEPDRSLLLPDEQVVALVLLEALGRGGICGGIEQVRSRHDVAQVARSERRDLHSY
ncbi:MAG TPA: hypothetical protein VN793_01825 [Acidimicrobiales bacterium]|nr:hypothetical protein [Acidimicrobiales bacterium]